MILRAKFRCDGIADYRPGYKGGKPWSEVTLSAAYSTSKEDNQFSEATPNGRLTMTVTTDTGRDYFEVGKQYYLDFSEAAS